MPIAPPSSGRLIIRKVGVLGAGTMGSRIAAHVANAGIPVVLLDIVPPGVASDAPSWERSKLALSAIELLKKSKPPAFYTNDSAILLTAGNIDDDMGQLADCEWIIEAVAEDLQVKHSLYERILRHKRPNAILTTNTSGLPISTLAKALPDEQRLNFFGTHFFNPPRYMRLVELIPLRETGHDAITAISNFCDLRLGKSVVISRDTPNFIANRIGTFALGNAIRLMQEQKLTIEEVDLLTGSLIGWPKTGTFRLADMVGVDVLAHVTRNFEAKSAEIGDERADLRLPPFIGAMLERQWLGDKSGQGFYCKNGKDAEGRDLRSALDWTTLEYRPAQRPKFASIDMAKNIESTSARVAQLLDGDLDKDKAAAFHWAFFTELFTYASNRVSADETEPAATLVEIDTAMRNGFNWELGPFELFDAVGVRAVTEKMRTAGMPVAPNVEKLLTWADTNGERQPCWYKANASTESGLLYFDPFAGSYMPVPISRGKASISIMKRAKGVLKRNPGASLVDIGDGVAAIELHSKRNALGGDIVSLLTQTLKPSGNEVAAFDAFVITGDSVNFSVGANLMQLLIAVQDEEWDEVDLMVRSFQNMTQAIKFCPRPVIVAPYGMCLGGGVEISLHAAARHVHAELYMGLVEAGVGLLPGGGGCKEMLLRSIEAGTAIRPDGRGEGVDIFEAVKKNFETIAKAVVSTSAQEARGLGFLRRSDQITINRERLLIDAKAKARSLAETGYSPPIPRNDIQAPGESVLATLKLAVWMMHEGQYISDHDMNIANHIAHVLAGGNVCAGALVSEQYLLDLEREAFLSLCGERKTQERIAFTLKAGRPLRN